MAKIHPPKRIEADYARKLRKIANIVGHIIEAHTVVKSENGEVVSVVLKSGLDLLLRNYANSLDGWAGNAAQIMLNAVNTNNAKYWMSISEKMAKQLKEERFKSVNGNMALQMQNEQVHLIKSLPLEAGLRAQRLAAEATAGGRRASEVADDIMKSGEVTQSRANTIARTEVSRAHAKFNQARAEYVGANNYIWRTMEDENVRESHAEMDGRVCNFDEPPTLSDGDSGNPGEFVNCRCYAEPIISSED